MTATTHARDVLGDATLGELEGTLRGRLVRPSDPHYDEARAVWNAAHDLEPALIIQCAGPADVVRGVEFARSEGLELAVRGGGSQHRRLLDQQRRGGPRPVTDEGHQGRPGHSPCRRTARAHLGRVRPRDPGVRAGGDRRPGVEHGDRRIHSRRRDRVAVARVRHDLRQPAVGRPGHRRRPARAPPTSTSTPTCSGRCAAAAATSVSSPRMEFQLHPVGPTVFAGPIFYAGADAVQVLRGWRDLTRTLPD